MDTIPCQLNEIISIPFLTNRQYLISCGLMIFSYEFNAQDSNHCSMSMCNRPIGYNFVVKDGKKMVVSNENIDDLRLTVRIRKCRKIRQPFNKPYVVFKI